ncbi:hypothetical protein LSCM1_01380 [Leishmania martiniquensis]|uniref:Fungal lipase-type domain-containing protein n=1 Tax=Leishmania martiniquensis TaxID=1580590 RepID=A0A836GWZ3_9TRYP|nr:hypothetical protein LSCM1_01380 [Leishmania martiniquensis]
MLVCSFRFLVCTVALFFVCGGAQSVVLPGEYSPADARRSLQYANATYADVDDIASWRCGSSCEANPLFKVTAVLRSEGDSDDLAYVGVDDSNAQVVVSLRGSSARPEWLMVWRLDPVLYDATSGCGSDCQVHASFQTSYFGLRRAVRAAVVSDLKMNPGYDILVTGHSFGAALAQLAAVDLQTHVNRVCFVSKPVVSLYTFGMPLVGNRGFAEWAAGMLSRGAHFRIRSGHDPVPQMFLGGNEDFQHVPHEVYCADDDPENCRVCEDSVGKEDPECIAGSSKENMQDHYSYFGRTFVNGEGGDVIVYMQPL